MAKPVLEKMGYRVGRAGRLEGLPETLAAVFAPVGASDPPVWIAGACRDAEGRVSRTAGAYPGGSLSGARAFRA